MKYDNSIELALLQEVASYDDFQRGIDMITDGRHGWRKNAKDSSFVCIGQKKPTK